MITIVYPFQTSEKETIREVLVGDGVMVFPTETFYAIGCLATSSRAVEKIYKLKHRQPDSPLLVLINSWSMLERYTDDLTPTIRTTLERYWPGALTAVLPHRGGLAHALNIPGKTVGFRMTPSRVAEELVGIVDLPLVGTSANISKKNNIAEFDQTRDVFGEEVDLYIDGGKTKGGLPSTVVDMTDNDQFRILRQGHLVFEGEPS